MQLWLLVASAVVASTVVAEPARIALVMGNGAYEQGRLKNPINDAQAVAMTLKSLGFDVQLLTDANQRDMDAAIENFGQRLSAHKGVGLFYYAGHGVQFDGVNYLMPLHSTIRSSADLDQQALRVDRVLQQMKAANIGVNIVILDACRDNPLPLGLSTPQRPGLAKSEATGDGMVIVYSTAPGETAEDGNGLHSPFTAALLNYLPDPRYHVAEMFNEVGLAVMATTAKKQIPWVSSSPFPKVYLAAETARAFRPESTLPDVRPPVNDPPVIAPVLVKPPLASPAKPLPLGIVLVSIPAGKFEMGSAEREDELPVHTVNVGSFQLMAHEVSQGQWQAVMGNNPSSFKHCGANCPVENVSWDDVQTFIDKLNQQSGMKFRLPSEAEWEYAARAGTTTAFAFGDRIDPMQANFNGRDSDHGSLEQSYREETVPVNSFRPNAWGLYNMHGNVWEWTQDCWNDSYQKAPNDGSAWLAGNCRARVLRGGSWIYAPEYLRSARRFWYGAGNRSYHYGFRLAMDN